jgi:hypothetical protein
MPHNSSQAECACLVLEPSCCFQFRSCVIVEFLSTWMQGISTYDYIVALREQEEQQEHVEEQSPQMSIISSVTGFSTTSSVVPLQCGPLCTPPRLLLEDQVCANIVRCKSTMTNT